MNVRSQTPRGFTLLELLLVILITGILAAVVAPLIHEPIRAYFDQTTRASLVDAADMSLRRMARDVRRALPFSIRINASRTAFEMVRVRDVGRYREDGNGNERLDADANERRFELVGNFTSIPKPYTLGDNGLDERMVVLNLGIPTLDVYAGDSVITPPGTDVDITDNGGTDQVEFNPRHEFLPYNGLDSPQHRVYIVDMAITYACSAGGLFRDENYGYLAAQPAPAIVAANGVLITDQVTSCRFDYDPGSANRPGLLIMTLTLTNDGESVTFLHQVHVPNTS
ncbi:MAG TPA: prepilin-type N-terminal cleavage/methylation domain-containing protein [Gammaproteobacteria bacterium]